MLMIVFGAGASYDSAPSYRPQNYSNPHRPPLAVELFQNRDYFKAVAQMYHRMLPIVPELRSTQDAPIEAVLERLRDESKTFSEGKRELAAVRYYLRDIIWDCTKGWINVAAGVTNYRSLLNQIERQRHGRNEQIVLVTFNYDTLLEDALSDKGFRRETIADYVTRHPTYKLFKLHGSIDWSRKVLDPKSMAVSKFDLIDDFPELNLGDRFILNLDRADHKEDASEFHVLFPAIAIPVQQKDDSSFECPKAHIQVLKELIPQVSQILFIGWRAQERHFLKMLREDLRSLSAIMVVDKNATEANKVIASIFEGLSSTEIGGAGAHANSLAAEEGFSTFIETREGDDFFRL